MTFDLLQDYLVDPAVLTPGSNVTITQPGGVGTAVEIAATGAAALSDLADVDLTGLADGDTLVWNATTSTWEPGAGSGGGGGGGSQLLVRTTYSPGTTATPSTSSPGPGTPPTARNSTSTATKRTRSKSWAKTS